VVKQEIKAQDTEALRSAQGNLPICSGGHVEDLPPVPFVTECCRQREANNAPENAR
jgi:hypothetical protein